MGKTAGAMFLVLSAMLPNNLRAAIVIYDFSGSNGAQTFSGPLTFDPLVIPLDVTRGSGLSSPAGLNSFNSAHWHDLSAEDYVSFGFSVPPGFEARLTSLTFTSRSSPSGPGILAVRSGRDGFTSNLLTWTQTGSSEANVAVDLSPLGSVSGLAEFRIFSLSDGAAGGGTVGSTGTWRIGTMTTPGTSNLLAIDGQVNAVAAVPEPASWLLSVFGLGAALAGSCRARASRAVEL